LGLSSGATSEDRCERTEQIVKFPLEAASRVTRLTRPENRVILQIRKSAKLDGKGLGDFSPPWAQRRVATRLIGSRAAPVGKDRRRVRQFLPSAVMTGLACLRGRTARTARPCQPHVGQRQFYCVKAPRRRTQGNCPYRIDAEGPDQNSAGRYPLISRPTQISTRIGVVQVIRRVP